MRSHVANLAHSIAIFAISVPPLLALIPACAIGTPDVGAGGQGGADDSWGVGGGSSSTSSTSASSSTSSTSASSSGFMPPQGTVDYPAETESNDFSSVANPLAMGTKGFTGSIFPVGDRDVFAVEITEPGSSLAVKIDDGMGGCPPGLSTLLRLTGPNGIAISTTGTCTQITPATHSVMGNLDAGTYYIQVESGESKVEPFYIVDIAITPPSCGDSKIQGTEQCDDGNAMAGDGCAVNCTLEGNYMTETEPNEPSSSANSLLGYDGVVAWSKPAGDDDYFSFDIAVDNSNVRIETSNGFGGCPPGLDSTIELLGPSGTSIAYDNDDGVNSCSLISWALDPEVLTLAKGTYTIRVRNFGAGINPYVLDVDVVAPGCGDGIAQSGEQCDDGNVNAGDGCAANCILEGNYITEMEPNDLSSTANSLVGYDGIVGSFQPAGNDDYFTFDIAVEDSQARIELSNGFGGCPPGVDSTIELLGPSGTSIAYDNDDGIGLCSLIYPALDPQVLKLAKGTYTIRVKNWAGAANLYVLDLDVVPPACGDGILQSGEQCDDGNGNAGDGCAANCVIEGNYKPEAEVNDAPMLANSLTGYDGAAAAIQPVGDQDYFSFDVTVPGSSVRIEITNGLGECPTGFDSKIVLLSPIGDILASDNDNGASACSLITPQLYPEAANLPTGTYTVKVEENGNNAVQTSYLLQIIVTPQGCGDGLLQPAEECDDGNVMAGDGCAPDCTIEGDYVQETEINNTQALANMTSGHDGAKGAIQPIGDLDYFSFDVTVPGSTVRIETTNGYGGCPVGFDSVISLYSPAGALLTVDDNNGAASCSLILPQSAPAATNLAIGTYKVRVEENGNNAAQDSYWLKIKVSAPGCGDWVLTPPEQCDDGNSIAGDGCNDMCMVEPPWEFENNGNIATATPPWPGTSFIYAAIFPAGDIDYFSFTLPAGKKPVLQTHAVNNAAACGFDSLMTLLNANGSGIASDNHSGVGTCSSISSATHPAVNNLSPGTYYVRVQDWFGDTTATYQLDIAFQ